MWPLPLCRHSFIISAAIAVKCQNTFFLSTNTWKESPLNMHTHHIFQTFPSYLQTSIYIYLQFSDWLTNDRSTALACLLHTIFIHYTNYHTFINPFKQISKSLKHILPWTENYKFITTPCNVKMYYDILHELENR
jgi:hypothetical protein